MWASWSVGIVAKLPFVACLSKLMAHLHKTENSILHVTREGGKKGEKNQWLPSDCIEFLVIEGLPEKSNCKAFAQVAWWEATCL